MDNDDDDSLRLSLLAWYNVASLIFILRLIVSSGIEYNGWEKHLSDMYFYSSLN
jgi:hypothetical protein